MAHYIVSFIFILVWAACPVFAQQSSFKKGEIQFKNGDYKGALENYTKEIKENPKNINAYYQRGFSYSMLENYKAAILDYTKVLETDPSFIWGYISRGSAKNKLKLYEEAIEDFNKAIGLDPKNQEAYNNRGWAKNGLNDKDGACKDWKKSKKLGNGEAKIIMEKANCK